MTEHPLNINNMSWDLKYGVWYKLRYRRQLGNYQWVTETMTAQFLGLNRRGDEMVFNLRPLAGTTELSVSHNPLLLVQISDNEEPELPRRVS